MKKLLVALAVVSVVVTACLNFGECSTDADCTGGDVCSAGQCVECDTDSDCDEGQTCNEDNECAGGGSGSGINTGDPDPVGGGGDGGGGELCCLPGDAPQAFECPSTELAACTDGDTSGCTENPDRVGECPAP